MGTNYIAPIWRMPKNANKDKLSNYSIEFDGNQNINCSNLTSLNSLNSFSTSTWINYSSTPSASTHVFLSGGTSVSDRFYVELISATQIRYGSGSAFDDITITSISAGDWHHLVTVHNATSLDIYLDGVKQNSSPVTVVAPTNNIGNSFMIGDYTLSQTYKWRGELSQVSIFDYALDQDQINYLYSLNNPMAITGAEPIAYWPLGDNSNPHITAGYPNISVGADSVFDFTPNDYIAGASTSFLNNATQMSFSVWFNLDTAVFNRGIIGDNSHFDIYTKNASGSNYSLRLNLNGNGNRFEITDRPFTAGKWHNLVTTFNAGTLNFYIDGNPVSYGVYSGSLPTSLSSSTGQLDIGRAAASLYWDGLIANAQVWNTELSSTEAQTIYNNGQLLMTGTQPQEANLKAWYKLNQSANWEADSSGDWQIPDNRSAYPQSFDFVRTSSSAYSRIFVHDGPFSYPTGKVSASIWFKWNGFKAFQTMIADDYTTGDDRIWWLGVDTNSNGKARFAVLDTAGNYNYIQSSTNLQAEKWYHIAVTYDGTTNADAMKLYLNNQLDSQGTTIAGGLQVPTSVPADYKVQIGHQSKSSSQVSPWGSSATPGELSNACIWDTNLGDAEIEALYNNGTPPTTAIQSANLKGWWKLDDTELFDNTNWSIENQKYPANYESAIEATELTGLELDSATPNLGTTQSFSWWVNYKKPSLGSYLWNKGSNGWRIYVYNNGTLLFRPTSSNTYMLNTGTGVIQAHQSIGNGKWYHYVLTRDGENVVIYQNSVSVYTGTIPGTDPAPATDDIDFIASEYGTLDVDTKFSNFCIFNNKLEQSDITSLYNNGTPLLNMDSFTSLQNWWKLNNLTTGLQASAGSINASVRSGTPGFNEVNTFVSTEAGASSGMTEQNLVNNNVSALNGESLGMNTTNLVQSNLTRTQPFSNYSYNLDGGTEYWTAGTTLGDSLGNSYTDPISVSIWINTGSLTQEQGIFSLCKNNATLDELSISLNYDFGYYWTLNANGNDAYISTGSAPITANTWHHLLCTFEPSAMKLYIDGQEISLSGTTTYTNLDLAGMETLIGGYYQIGVKEFLGYLSNCAVWNQILTQDDALNLYNNGVPQDLNNFRVTPIRWWSLDQNYSYWDGTNIIGRDEISGDDVTGINIAQVDLEGNAPGSDANGSGNNLAIADLIGDMKDSKLNAYSINMADYADGVTNPANSGRSTDTP